MSQLTRNQKQMAARNYMVIAFFMLAVILICVFSAALIVRSFQPARRVPLSDIPSVTVETLVTLEGERAYPEAMTLGKDGYLYSGSFCTGELWRINPDDGALETWLPAGAGIGAASGMAFSEDGTLYIVDRGDCDPRRSTVSLKRILPDKTVEEWGSVTNDEILNSLAFDAAGLLYATDTQLQQVRVFDAAGQPSVWWEVPFVRDDPLPTGLTYDAQRHALLVADSGNGIIYRVPIGEDGAAGLPETLYDRRERSLDGLTMDERGNIYFTSYDNNEVVLLQPDGSTTILARDFREPSDVAYLDGRVYVVNFDSLALVPIVTILIDPSLPFTIDMIDIRALQS